jgi:hypothetical protein
MITYLKLSIKNKFIFKKISNSFNTTNKAFSMKLDSNLQRGLFKITKFNFCNKNKNTIKKANTEEKNTPTNINQSARKKGYLRLLKENLKKYGLFGIYLYVITYIITLNFFFILVKTKIIDSSVMLETIEQGKLGKYINVDKWRKLIGEQYTDAILIIILNEIFEVVRLPFLSIMLPSLYTKYKKFRGK